jgi:hypothetical protein
LVTVHRQGDRARDGTGRRTDELARVVLGKVQGLWCRSQYTDPQIMIKRASDRHRHQKRGREGGGQKREGGEGSQFVKGFGGIGGLLRYKVDFAEIADAIEQGDEEARQRPAPTPKERERGRRTKERGRGGKRTGW